MDFDMRIIFFSLLVLSFCASANNIQPSSQYSPEEVIDIIFSALKNNDQPITDSGIEQTFMFASPLNKKNTGPLSRFKKMVKQPIYATIIDHRSVEKGPIKVISNRATIPLIVTSLTGELSGFLWVLSKQTTTPYKDVWMTDSVQRVELNQNLNAM